MQITFRTIVEDRARDSVRVRVRVRARVRVRVRVRVRARVRARARFRIFPERESSVVCTVNIIKE